jgi:hypothetical protein
MPAAWRFRSLVVPPILLVLGAVAALAQGPPDFSGQWRFNPQRSDDVRAAVAESVGPAYASGDARKEAARSELRAWLLAVVEKPDSQLLTVEQTAAEFRYGFGDDVAIFYFAREGTRQAASGEKDRTRLRWQGQQLLVEQVGDRGTRATTIFTPLPGGRQLSLTFRMENKALRKPLDLRLGFDRVAANP